MIKAEILNKTSNFGMREDLGAMPLPKVYLVKVAIGKTLGEGAEEKDEKGKTIEETFPSAQPPLKTTTMFTQPSPTKTTQNPILTSTITIPATTPMSAPTDIFVTTSTTLPLLTQVLKPAIETIIIHNIEMDSD